jgi:hypothetical protein
MWAWEQWKASVDIDQLDPASHRLLPLLYRNLHAHEVRDPWLGRLKGVYRRTWYENQLLFHQLTLLVQQLRDAGIETMLLKGVALVLLYYRDHGLRPMADCDLAVPLDQALAAVRVLQQSGWQPMGKFLPSAVLAKHGQAFVSTTGQELDLHWHVLQECCSSWADNEFWESAAPITLNTITTRTLNPTDLLLQVCVHGARWNPIPPIRWVADAMMILRSSETEIDWKRLLARAQAHHLILPLKDTLRYVRELLDAPIPTAVTTALQQMPVSTLERFEYAYKTHDHRPKLLGYLPVLWFDYGRSSLSTNTACKPLGFLKYLQYFWGFHEWWRTPFHALFLLWGRILRGNRRKGSGLACEPARPNGSSVFQAPTS